MPVAAATTPAVDGWLRSSPEAQGVDSRGLVQLFDAIDGFRYAIRSVIVVRHGYLVLEAYTPLVGPDTRQPIYSCTKSLTSALVGIALDRGYLSSLDTPMLDFFPGRRCANPDPLKRSITLENLLTMTPGVKWWEMIAFHPDNTLMQMERSVDWVQFFLDLPLQADPGTAWEYDSGGAHVLSAIIQQECGQSLAVFAQENLLAPLGIGPVDWPADPQGISYGYRGVSMTAPDMARFGLLYAQGGAWEGRRILSEQWVKESTRRRIGAAFGQGYACLWWVPPFGGHAANGYMGQRIFVLPERDLVVVMTSGITGQAMMSLPESLMIRFILPAVTSAGPLPENPGARAQLEDRLRAFGR